MLDSSLAPLIWIISIPLTIKVVASSVVDELEELEEELEP